MANDPNYVTRLMRIRCDKGTMDNYINVGTDHGVLAGADQQPVLNANDHTDKNIIHCGNCESEDNPESKFRKGIVSAAMGPLGFFIGDMVTDFLQDVGIMATKCKPNTPLPWINVNDDNILEGAPALTIDSTCPCRYGGAITFVPLDEYPPEEPAAMAEHEDEEKPPPPEDVVGDAVAEALDKAMAAVAETGSAGEAAVASAQVAMAAAAAMPPSSQSAHSCERDGSAGRINSINDITFDKAVNITETQRAKNYAHNMAQTFPTGSLDPNGMVINQGMLGDFIINNATVEYGGCGAISLYNTVKTLNPSSDVTFAQAIYWMEPYGILNNSFGAVPTGVSDALKGMGYETSYCFSQDPAEISAAAAQADAAITLYATTKNVHYVAFHADPKVENMEQTFTFYNEMQGGVGDSRTYEDFKGSLTDDFGYRKELGSITILVNKDE